MSILLYCLDRDIQLAAALADEIRADGSRVSIRNADYWHGEIEATALVAWVDGCEHVAFAYEKAGVPTRRAMEWRMKNIAQETAAANERPAPAPPRRRKAA